MIYAFNSIALTVGLFAVILVLNEIGFRIGRFVQLSTHHTVRELTGSVQGSVLGILALLLGFTFSMAMQRYDQRQGALIDETNAIGTAQLRAELLAEPYRAAARQLLGDYVELRIAAADVDLTRRQARLKAKRQTAEQQQALWTLGVEAANADPRPTTTGAFATALTAMIDAQGKRNALLQMHVPEVVMMLLFLVFASSGGMLGYSSGLGGHRILAPTALVSFLIAMVVFIIIDLDRPRRGLIQVDQTPLVELRNPAP